MQAQQLKGCSLRRLPCRVCAFTRDSLPEAKIPILASWQLLHWEHHRPSARAQPNSNTQVAHNTQLRITVPGHKHADTQHTLAHAHAHAFTHTNAPHTRTHMCPRRGSSVPPSGCPPPVLGSWLWVLRPPRGAGIGPPRTPRLPDHGSAPGHGRGWGRTRGAGGQAPKPVQEQNMMGLGAAGWWVRLYAGSRPAPFGVQHIGWVPKRLQLKLCLQTQAVWTHSLPGGTACLQTPLGALKPPMRHTAALQPLP